MLPDEQGDPEFEHEEKKTFGDAAKAFPTSGTIEDVSIVNGKGGQEVHALFSNDLGKYIAKATTEPEMSKMLDTEGEHIDFVCLDTMSKSDKSGLPIFRVLKVNPTHAEMLELTKGIKPEPPAEKKGKSK
jgi:hypothetical protein